MNEETKTIVLMAGGLLIGMFTIAYAASKFSDISRLEKKLAVVERDIFEINRPKPVPVMKEDK